MPGGRAIQVITTETESAALEVAFLAYLASFARPVKVLVFGNSRKRVDELTAVMRPRLVSLGYPSRSHLGSSEPATSASKLGFRDRRPCPSLAITKGAPKRLMLEVFLGLHAVNALANEGKIEAVPGSTISRVGLHARHGLATRMPA